jgi:outer membrane protein TolC
VQAVFLAAIQAFYQVQANDAALLASQESERAAGEALRAADARYRVGSGTPADRLQAQTAYSQATLQRISAQGNVHIARGTLANTIGRDAQKSPPLVPASDPPADARFADDVDTLIDEARRRRPDLRASEAQLRSAEADRDAARAAGWPSVTLAATANNTDTGIASASRDGSLGVRLDIPLFTGFATHYRVRSAEAQREVKEAQREKLRLQVALDVWNAYQNLITATQSVKSAADLLDSAEQSARVALGRYQAGVGIILDLLNAQSALASARLQEVQAKYNWRTARATLAQAIGTLDAGLLQPSPGSAPASAEFNAAEFNAAKAKARP